MYLRSIQANLLGDFEIKSKLVKKFKMLYADTVKLQSKGLDKTVCKIVSRKLALQQRQKSAGVLLASIRSVKSISLEKSEDFGDSCHSASTGSLSACSKRHAHTCQ